MICNICHTGCLDCHYTPSRERGVHAFSRTPPALSCGGGGRSTFVCHAGTMERRRGDSYLGKEFSEPPGLPEDVHVRLKMECVACHQTGPGGMGHIERRGTCQDCHIEAEEAIAASDHKNVSCAACHVKILGGYEVTSWGSGLIASRPNPFKKYALYYGPMEPPILVKDQAGRWIPMKVWPNSAGNFKTPVTPRPGIIFRWPDGETHDAYALLGTHRVPKGNNLYLAWLQLDQVGHPLGKSRTCTDCHGRTTQAARASWEYYDSQGAEPFEGTHRIIGDEKGLRVTDLRITSELELMHGGKTEDFAAWLHLGDIWKTPGDFSIPKSDPRKYRELDRGIKASLTRLDRIDRRIKAREARGEKVKKLRRRWKEAKAAAAHDPKTAGPLIEEVFTMNGGEGAPVSNQERAAHGSGKEH